MHIERGNYQSFASMIPLLRLVFPQDDPRYYRNFLLYDPLFDPTLTWQAKEGGKVVSCVWLLPRQFTGEKTPIFAGGIANVATHPDFRGRGLASLLIEEALREAKKRKWSFVFLMTDIPHFYEKWGFREKKKFSASLPPSSSLPLRSRPAPLLERLEIYGEFYRRFNLVVPLRNPAYERGLSRWNRYSAFFHEGREVARWMKLSTFEDTPLYAYLLQGEKEIRIFDLFWPRKTSDGTARAMIGALATRAKKTVVLFHHPQVLETLGFSPQPASDTVMILSFHTPKGEIYLPPADAI